MNGKGFNAIIAVLGLTLGAFGMYAADSRSVDAKITEKVKASQEIIMDALNKVADDVKYLRKRIDARFDNQQGG